MFKNFKLKSLCFLFVCLMVAASSLGCATTKGSSEDTAIRDNTTITAPYGARLFCEDNPQSELCVSDEEG